MHGRPPVCGRAALVRGGGGGFWREEAAEDGGVQGFEEGVAPTWTKQASALALVGRGYWAWLISPPGGGGELRGEGGAAARPLGLHSKREGERGVELMDRVVAGGERREQGAGPAGKGAGWSTRPAGREKEEYCIFSIAHVKSEQFKLQSNICMHMT